MQSSITLLFKVIFLLIFCNTLYAKNKTWEEWAESQHPPSDKSPLPEGCKAVRYRGLGVPVAESIDESGRHCIVHDFVQRKINDLISGKQKGSPIDAAGNGRILSFFRSNNADLDLRQHLVSGRPFENTRGVGTSGNKLTYLRVHNGKIDTPGPLGIGVEMTGRNVGLRKRIYLLNEDFPVVLQVGWNSETQKFNEVPWNYSPPTFYTAENLQIQSGGRAIVMAGADNVVRNNTIEVDGRTAVYLYGPRSLVEGNTFIVHMDPRDRAPLPAILKLRDADGSIIRNNRFIVKRSGLFRKKETEPQAGINLLESRDVLIEGNVFEQVDLPLRKDEASTVTQRDGALP